MRPKTIPLVKAGDVLTTSRWNDLVDAVNRAGLNLGDGCNLEAQFAPFGTALRATFIPQLFRGVVTTVIPTGTITVPSDTGRVSLYEWDGIYSTVGETGVQVLNDHTLGASIAVNKVVKLGLIDGYYWLIAADC